MEYLSPLLWEDRGWGWIYPGNWPRTGFPQIGFLGPHRNDSGAEHDWLTAPDRPFLPFGEAPVVGALLILWCDMKLPLPATESQEKSPVPP